MNDPIICIARFIAKPDKVSELCSALQALLAPTRAEAGCLSYVLHQGVDNPLLFTMVEKFTSREAFDFHSAQPYLAAVKPKLAELTDSVAVELFAVVGE